MSVEPTHINPIHTAQQDPDAMRDIVASLKRRSRRGTAAYLKTPRQRHQYSMGGRPALQSAPTTGKISRRRIRDSYVETVVKSQEFGAVVTQHNIRIGRDINYYKRYHNESKTAWFTPFNNNPAQGPQFCWEQLMRAST